MTTHRSWQRPGARLGAIFVAISALLSVVTIDNASATVSSDEPAVQIGESRSIERSESTVAPAAQTVDSSVAGVAVAGVAIARDAPPIAYRLDMTIPDDGTNPLPFFVGGLCVVAAIVAALYLRVRRL
ncbi:MAG: hypothetical protein ABI658_32705, partial [Acidimicrobiales bacterium]